MAGCCEHGNETLTNIKCDKFFFYTAEELSVSPLFHGLEWNGINFGLLDTEKECNKLFKHMWKHSHRDTASHPRWLQSS